MHLVPAFRVKEELPFTNTGMDFAGPLFIKSTDSKETSKVWICLYICCIVREVHLDIVQNLHFSIPQKSQKIHSKNRTFKFLSDNGKAFKLAAKTIREIVNNEEVQEYFSGIGVEWLFNIERALLWGGVFKRMVKITKICFRKMIGRAKLSFDELLTAITEVEMVINSRPLTYVSMDDIEEALTPSHLIMGRRILRLPDDLCYQHNLEDDIQVTPACLTKRMKYLNTVMERFWKRRSTC